MTTFQLILFITAIVIWAVSFIMRRRDPNSSLGKILSWVAAGLAVLIFILKFLQ